MFWQVNFAETNVTGWKLSHFDHMSLWHLNTAQLQVIVNDQLNRIEGMLFKYFVLIMANILLGTMLSSGVNSCCPQNVFKELNAIS